MSTAAQRLLIAMKSPLQRQVDTRPRCEDCGKVLERHDFTSYWDGQDPYVDGCLGRGESTVPRCCDACADQP